MRDIDRWDVCVFAGGLLLAIGCGLWAFPLGLVVGGVELLAVGVMGARAVPVQARTRHEPRSLEG